MASVVRELIAKNVVRSSPYPQNLFQLASVLPKDGVGCRLVPEKWLASAPASYYTLTHIRITPGMTQGIISGTKTWQGKTDELPTPIPQNLALEIWRLYDDAPKQ